MEKILSIIVPSYNMEAYLPKCLGSLIVDDNELLQKLDVIVVNDGSKDRTSEIAHEFEAKYPGVFRVIDKKNGNYGSCVNAGLRLIRGKYVRILDADDTFNSAEFQKYLEFLMTCDCDLILNDYIFVNPQGETVDKSHINIVEYQDIQIESILEKFRFIVLYAITYKASIFASMPYTQSEGVSYTDTQWSILPLGMVKRVIYCPRFVYRYLVGREGQTMERATVANNFWMMGRAALDTLRVYLKFRDNIHGEHQRLMDLRVTSFAASIYRSVLENSREVKYNLDLDSYDKELASISSDFYDKVGSFRAGKYLKCLVVLNWRRHTAWSDIKNALFFRSNMYISRLARIKHFFS